MVHTVRPFGHHHIHKTTDMFVDDTCVQAGYWAAVAHFINTLVPLDQP